MKMTTTEIIAEAVSSELELSARIAAAKNAAINQAYSAALQHAAIYIHGFDAAKSGAGLMQVAINSVNAAFDRIDFEAVLEDAVKLAAYKKGMPAPRMDAAAVLANSSAEFRTGMAEQILAGIGSTVAGVMIEGIDSALKDANHGR